MPKLHTITPKSFVRIPDAEGAVLFFDHLDGMYSFCRDERGNIVHIACWADVEVIDKPATWPEESK